jgi:hypothetical protein
MHVVGMIRPGRCATHIISLLVLAAGAAHGHEEAPLPTLGETRVGLDRAVDRMLASGRLVRADGYVYAIDLDLLVLGAALSQNRARYERLVDLAQRSFILERPAGIDAAVVVWRRRLDATTIPDASGTTEALQLARGLLLGAEVFRRPDDAASAERLLMGYAKHADVIDGVWIVRNYFNLQTRCFATNSYLIDYGPDLLAEVGARRSNRLLQTTAGRSVAVIRSATRPNGLIDMIVQPEVRTLSNLTVFSPNDVIKLEHAALVAELAAVQAPDIARGVLAFARQHLDDLRTAYLGSTGLPYDTTKADAGTLAALARLAIKLRDRDMIQKLRLPLQYHAATLAKRPDGFDVHVIAQTLLALELLLRWDQGRPLPLARM